MSLRSPPETILISLSLDEFQTIIIDCVNVCLKYNPAKTQLKKEGKTPIEVIIVYAPMRVRNILLGWRGKPFMYIEDVTREKFIKCRNAGPGAWEDFCRTRESEIWLKEKWLEANNY